MNLFLIYLLFFQIGVFAIGGGLATLPFLFQMADRYEWLNQEMIGNFLAIAQMSPGAIGVNVASQTGFQYGGIPGAILAALGLVSPAIVIISFIARVMQSFRENTIVKSVFSGLRPAAAGLLASAFLMTFMLVLFNRNSAQWYQIIRLREFVLFVVLYLLMLKFKFHPVIYIAAGALAGILLGL